MKATIIRPDGTRIEAEGTPEEITDLSRPLWRVLTVGTVHVNVSGMDASAAEKLSDAFSTITADPHTDC